MVTATPSSPDAPASAPIDRPALGRSGATRRTVGPLAAVLITLSLVVVLVPTPSSPSPSTAQAGSFAPAAFPVASTFPISHVVFLMMENHAYDNYFGVYCQKVNRFCPLTGNGIPPGTCVPTVPGNQSSPCIKPFALNRTYVAHPVGGTHNLWSSYAAYDNGSMDGFYRAAPYSAKVLGYYNGSTLPEYWNLAEQYGLGDDFFSSALDYSLPNHWYAIAGQAPEVSFSNFAVPSPTGHYAPLTPDQELYLNQSNVTTTLNDEIAGSAYTWKFYDDSFQNATYEDALVRTQAGNTTQTSVFNYWNPLAAKAESYTAGVEPNVVNRSTFYTDAATGNLPNVSWIIPSLNQSDHPINSLAVGSAYVASVINAVQNSSEWGSTAVFVTWDEYGGYYDHVAPPQIDGHGLGFRVPLLVVSPYTPVGYISHVYSRFESVLHFMEWRFGLSSFTTRDADAALPLDYFDLNATPRAPRMVYTSSPYPLPIAVQTPVKVSGLRGVSNATATNLTWSQGIGGSPVTGFTVRWGPVHGALKSVVVPRTVNQQLFGGLTCNTTYVFQVTAFSGPNVSAPLGVITRTGVCSHVVRASSSVSPMIATLANARTDGRGFGPRGGRPARSARHLGRSGPRGPPGGACRARPRRAGREGHGCVRGPAPTPSTTVRR